MTATVIARARMALPANQNTLSASRGGSVSMQLRGLDTPTANYVAIGPVVGGPPATMADFTLDEGGDPLQQEFSQSIVFDPGTNTFTMTFVFPVAGAVFALGDEVWVGLFEGVTGSPAPTDAPVATAGPFVVAA